MAAREGLAYLLALLLKWKVLEAFVVPTGAMAPTIYGAHSDVVCQNCGMKYAVTMSMVAQNPQERRSVHASCPNCGQTTDIGIKAPILQGDRILVDKISQPRRWDPIVFRFPKDRRLNYVKRLVGLPGETLEIADGGIFINGRRLRREPSQARDMWLLVHDSNYRPKRPPPDSPHWEPKTKSSRWTLVDGQWTFEGISTTDDALTFSGRLTDELAYNEQEHLRELAENAPLVGDIRLALDLKQFSGEGSLELHWEFRDQKIRAKVSADGKVEMLVSAAPTAGEGGKSGENIVHGKLIGHLAEVGQLGFAVRDGQAYVLQGPRVVATVAVGPQDLASVKLPSKKVTEPCRLEISASRCKAVLSRVMLWRDVYYCNLSRMQGTERFPAWGCTGHPINLGKGEYFVLGDNSSVSSDSRFWGPVPADDLIGVGRLIYWPYDRWHQFQ
jgi:signal peptidase I